MKKDWICPSFWGDFMMLSGLKISVWTWRCTVYKFKLQCTTCSRKKQNHNVQCIGALNPYSLLHIFIIIHVILVVTRSSVRWSIRSMSLLDYNTLNSVKSYSRVIFNCSMFWQEPYRNIYQFTTAMQCLQYHYGPWLY